MAIQKRLVSMHPRKGILNIDVVSFERLAYKVFDEVGEDYLEVLQDKTNNLIIKFYADSLLLVPSYMAQRLFVECTQFSKLLIIVSCFS